MHKAEQKAEAETPNHTRKSKTHMTMTDASIANPRTTHSVMTIANRTLKRRTMANGGRNTRVRQRTPGLCPGRFWLRMEAS